MTGKLGAEMKIAIIGSGNVGAALPKALRRARHAVTFGARAPDPARADETTISTAVGDADATVFKTCPVMFVAGDDEAAKPLVLQLVTDAGFEAIDAGKLHAARLIEPLAMLWIEQGRFRGMGPDFAFTCKERSET
jgi:predicted dinucleotide-binding enzyme